MEPIAQDLAAPDFWNFSLTEYKNASRDTTQELLPLLAGYITGSVNCLEDTCEKTFTCRRVLLRHYKKKHIKKKSIHEDISRMYGPEKYHCLFCNQNYFKYEQLLVHMKINHEQQTTPVEAHEYPECLIEPTILPEWQLAIPKYQTSKKYECNPCNKLFCSKSELENHRNRKHGGIKIYACDHHRCSGSYTTKASLKVHQLRMHGEKKYKCLECNLKFSMKGDLNQHYLRSH
jgi:KRAB domain-containing zinc finger protein